MAGDLKSRLGPPQTAQFAGGRAGAAGAGGADGFAAAGFAGAPRGGVGCASIDTPAMASATRQSHASRESRSPLERPPARVRVRRARLQQQGTNVLLWFLPSALSEGRGAA